MPSRADTRVFALVPFCEGKGYVRPTEFAAWTARTSAGLFVGPSAGRVCDRTQRAHRLSPLIPAAAALRTVAQGRGGSEVEAAAMVVVAEQTLSMATAGGAAAWVLRDGELALSVTSGREQSLGKTSSSSAALRLEDVVVLTADSASWQKESLLAAAAVAERGADLDAEKMELSLWLRCVEMPASEVWSPLRSDAPHPSWARTIFNEYGTHKEKL